MAKLTRSLRETLRGVAPYDGDPAFGDAIMEQRSLVPGIGPYRLINDLADLEETGYVKIVRKGRRVESVCLRAAGRDFSRNPRTEAIKAVGRYLFQFLVGTSGGLAALLVSRLLFQ